MKRTSILVLILEDVVGLHRPSQLLLLRHQCLGHRQLTEMVNGFLWKQTEIILSFLRLHPSTVFRTLLLIMGATQFLLWDFCPQ